MRRLRGRAPFRSGGVSSPATPSWTACVWARRAASAAYLRPRRWSRHGRGLGADGPTAVCRRCTSTSPRAGGPAAHRPTAAAACFRLIYCSVSHAALPSPAHHFARLASRSSSMSALGTLTTFLALLAALYLAFTHRAAPDAAQRANAFVQAISARRTVYALNDTRVLPSKELVECVSCPATPASASTPGQALRTEHVA